MGIIKQLRQDRADLVREASATFDNAVGRDLTASERHADDQIAQKLVSLDMRIAVEEAAMDRQRNGPAMGQAPLRGNGSTGFDAGGAFASFGDQMLAVARQAHPDFRGDTDQRLTAAAGPTGLSEGISSDGGFLVQSDYSDELLQSVVANSEIFSRIRRIPLSANANGFNASMLDETSRANGSRWGGVQAYWTGEAQLKQASQPKFRRLKMELSKLTGLCYVSDELLQDSVALDAWLKAAFQAEFTFKIEDAILSGTGAGMPLGILNSPSKLTVAKDSGQATGSINANNILRMWSRMPASSRKNAVWLINQDAEPQLFQLAIMVKNVAGTENVGGIVPSVDVAYIPPGRNGNALGMLLGRPVIPTEYNASLGTEGDIILADLSQYLGIDKGPTQFASSIHVRFIYDETAFRFVYRFNGQPMWSTPLSPYKGINNMSPFITLQTR